MTDQTPPTDRPLTAGDWIEWRGGENPVPGQRVIWKNAHGDYATALSDDVCGLGRPLGRNSPIIAYRLARPAASEGEGVGDSSGLIDAKRLVSRLRELEALHESRLQEPLVSYAQGLESGMADAMGSVADWIEAGDFDATLASPPVSERERELEAEVIRLREAGEAIYIYANDTLSGRVDGPDDREWQRSSVVEIRNRARIFRTFQPKEPV